MTSQPSTAAPPATRTKRGSYLKARSAIKNEDERHRRRLEIEGWRLVEQDMEAPDDDVEQRHVEYDREIDRPVGQPPARCPVEPDAVDDDVEAYRGRDKDKASASHLRRHEVQGAPDRRDDQLNALCQHLAAIFLFFDCRLHLQRHCFAGAWPEHRNEPALIAHWQPDHFPPRPGFAAS